MKHTVAVIGDGAMGTICSIMLAENGHTVRLWSAFEEQAAAIAAARENARFLPGRPLPDRLIVTADPAEAFADVTFVLSAVPTEFLRTVWQRLVPHYLAGTPICSVTKGIENGSLQTPAEIIAEVLGEASGPLAALSGPSIVPEIAQGLPATVTIASDDQDLAEQIQQAISRPYFRAYTNSDMLGVELAGATKNVIAIAAGILDGLGMGDNAKAALVTRGLVEITRLGLAAGAQQDTFAGLAGMGDLITTCFSPVGRNRSFGERIGQGATVADALAASRGVVEGLATCRSVVAMAEHLGVEMPLTESLAEVLFSDKAPREAIATLMTRPLRCEQRSEQQ